MPKALVYIASGMLFAAVIPFPYGYYILLRFVVCFALSWAALIAYKKNDTTLLWVFFILAILFNPFEKIYLPKDIWIVVDFSVGILLLLLRKRIAV